MPGNSGGIVSSTTTAVVALEPNPRAASLARAFLAGELEHAEQDVRDVALLLVSELVTNAVVHAASGVEVEVHNGPDGIVVRVRDADTGPLVMRAGAGSELDEGGRGIMLIDRLSDAWGTEHHGGRKTVWFRIASESTQTKAAPRPQASAATDLEATHAARRMLRTLVVRSPIEAALAFDEHVGELLGRIIDATGAAGAAVTFAGGTPATVRRGDVSGDKTCNRDLVVGDHRYGTLSAHLAGEPDDDTEAFLDLAADRLALLAAENGAIESTLGRSTDHDFLSEATELLSGSLSVSLSLTLLTQIAVPRLGDWCAAFTVDDRRRPRRVTVNHRQEDRTDAVQEVLAENSELRQAIFDAARTSTAERHAATVTVAGRRDHVAVLPLLSRGRILGILVVGGPVPLDAIKFMSSLELARRASVAVDNARLHEEQVATASALQKSLLPSALPSLPSLDLAARYHSASPGMEVGGDFYDAITLTDGSTVFAIGDVCGKGAEAAVVTGMSRDLLRLLVQDGVDPALALRRLNRALIDHPSNSRFCTVALARVKLQDGLLSARLCLAGHPEPVLVHSDGRTELVGVPGDLLGVLDEDELTLSDTEVSLEPGDSLVLYTDGITERRSGTRMFGQGGLRDTLARSAGASADRIAHALEQAAESFVDTELRDDLAILVIRHAG
jgi:phosphoserine phosphatase RsbU/P